MYKAITSEQQIKKGARIRKKATGEEHSIGDQIEDGRYHIKDAKISPVEPIFSLEAIRPLQTVTRSGKSNLYK